MHTISVTNDPQSKLAKMTDLSIASEAGKEEAITATKSFTATLLATYALIIGSAKRDDLMNKLSRVPAQVDQTIQQCEEKCRRLAFDLSDKEFFFILGSGSDYATALEAALKLKESCNIYAEGFATREFLHGPMQLVDNRTPVFIIQHESSSEILELADEFRRFGAPTIIVGPHNNETAGEMIETPDSVEKLFSPLTNIIPLQLFAYYSSIARKLNPDRPTKLKKVVK